MVQAIQRHVIQL